MCAFGRAAGFFFFCLFVLTNRFEGSEYLGPLPRVFQRHVYLRVPPPAAPPHLCSQGRVLLGSAADAPAVRATGRTVAA